jgi:multimeric flavodoxin WrbA
LEKLKVKILGISCSNRLNSDVAWMVQYALKVVEKFGRRVSEVADYETEFVDLGDKDLKPCLNCNRRPCTVGGGMIWEGDGLPVQGICKVKDYHQVLGPKLQEADGWIIGAPTTLGTYNSTFRLLFEALSRGRELLFGEHWFQHNNRLPVGVLTCADDGPGAGTETCLNDMNTVLKFVELEGISLFHGTSLFRNPCWRQIPEGEPYTVKNNRDYFKYLFLTARRVAEFALMLKLTKQTLGDLYHREFIGRNHEPWGTQETWAWKRLDKEDEEYMMNLAIETKLPNRSQSSSP